MMAYLSKMWLALMAGTLAAAPANAMDPARETEARMTASLATRTATAATLQDADIPAPRISAEELDQHLPSPTSAEAAIRDDLQRWKHPNAETKIQKLLDTIATIQRPTQVHLSLDDAIRRMLAHGYRIEQLSYNPAIGTASVVQAQAAFDAAFFTSITKDKRDQPTPNQLISAGSDLFILSTGIEKILASGMSVRGQYTLRRSEQSFAFQTLNPAYTSEFSISMRQPLLQGFGIDYNRSLIVIARKGRGVDELAFRGEIEFRLRELEQLYWNLVQARRNFIIRAREVADFDAIYTYLQARRDWDVLPVNLFTTQAALSAAKTNLVADRTRVFDAEDQLIAAMNDPKINLIDDVELIPTDFPTQEPFSVDRVAEVQVALDHRTDIQAQQLAVDIKKINVSRAKNQELPQLDVSLTVTSSGLSDNADRSFDEVSQSNFLSYNIGVEYRVPIGNRSARAVRRQEELGYAQELAKMRWTIEEAIRDVNLAVRQLKTSFDQLQPGFESLEARQREVNSHVARAERKDYATLTTELSAWRSLAATRRDILNLMVTYNNAIIDLEWKKGTLLPYNNIVIQPADEDGR